MVGELARTEVVIENHPSQAGDAKRNGGATDKARALLGWEPKVSLREGIAAQLGWHDTRRAITVS
jgi:nucleoside-diphosphate-sugar epimerase